MSLLNEAMVSCTRMIKTMTDDGYGGQIATWTQGEAFEAAMAFGTPKEDRRADLLGTENRYTVITSRDVVLSYGDHFVRADGKAFKVTADGLDRKTPASAGLDMRAVTAEELEDLPT